MFNRVNDDDDHSSSRIVVDIILTNLGDVGRISLGAMSKIISLILIYIAAAVVFISIDP